MNERDYDLRERRQRMLEERRRRVRRNRILLGAAVVLIAAVGFFGIRRIFSSDENQLEEGWEDAPAMKVELLTPNEYSRPEIPLEKINGIVVHYTANPGSSAEANRNYFEGLKDSGATYASSHFIIGLKGEIIQCIPSKEIAYASNERNEDTLSIECCHPDESGVFTDATYDSLVDLVAWLCQRFGLQSTDVIRHYDVTGKICPKAFVEDEQAWEQFRSDVAEGINKLA
ncbi:MAG TPA: N-acetylmuramoyl-L-alanine amidase [Candidatus Egerieimonas intestinavium]|uniref:N-acetylmuramoyl-L-alanine amidase n=1 Tax=Candidatus Egerieimonas intestinavium TaxID=2840777 RepID=A0A9D1EKJ0_9FIRM|nr:N-acetylmuramoyl-L-alanine amidase [Candidatus Egerieimonas intestinavium]